MARLDKILVWQRQDGGVSITHLDDRDMIDGETEDDFIARYTQKLQPSFPGITPSLVNASEVPSERTYRNEWSLKNGKVEVDPVKVQAKADKEAEKQNKRQAILSKLKISEEELADLLEN